VCFFVFNFRMKIFSEHRCVVCQGSGRAADLLADAYSGFKDALQVADSENMDFQTVLRENILHKLGTDATDLQVWLYAHCSVNIDHSVAARLI